MKTKIDKIKANIRAKITAVKQFITQILLSPVSFWRWCKNKIKQFFRFIWLLPMRFLRFCIRSIGRIILWLLKVVISWFIGVAVVIGVLFWLVDNKFSGLEDNFMQFEQAGQENCEPAEHHILYINSASLAPLLAKQSFVPIDFATNSLPEHWGDLHQKLQQAAYDDGVQAVLIDYQGLWSSRAGIAELREQLKTYKQESGKKVYLFVRNQGEYHGIADYGLHDVADKIYLAPSGYSAVKPVGSEQFYLSRLFDTLKIKPEFIRRHEYKSAPSMFTSNAPTNAERENTSALIADIEQIYRAILRPRFAPDGQAFVFSAQETLRNNLADEIIYRDDLLETLQAQNNISDDARYLALSCYQVNPLFALFVEPKNVQIINIKGTITPDIAGQPTMGSRALRQIKRANDDDDIAALLIYIDSSGGDYAMSERIWHALYQTEKPVAVLMGNVAASGGYFIAVGGDKIFAYPSTITGSIGIFTGHFALRDFFNETLSIDTYVYGGTGYKSEFLDEYSPEYRAQMEKFIDALYDDFVNKVALSRDINKVTMNALARGRVFSGTRALQNDLLDGVNGLQGAVDYLEETLGQDIILLPEQEEFDFATALGQFVGQSFGPKVTEYLYQIGILQNGMRMQSDY
ncbi:MAG: S49 family peptidase [Alphaproteobacteria bacterium]|nr:S49 family peptidase [Alphaproteobacteria bacterium]